MFVNFNILNQLGSPSINSNTFANRPAAGQTGRLFVSTDTFEIYRDNGTTWDLIGGPGSSTITGTGTATQVAYFTSSQAIGSSANLYWDNTAGALGINTNAPTAELDVHGSGVMAQLNATSATVNSLLAFQRSGIGLWRIGDNYNAGTNFFELYNTSLSTNAIAVLAATNKTEFTAVQTYSTGLARGNYFDYNLNVPAGTSFSSPNAITALGASLDLSLAGNATIPSGARTGLDAYNTVSFTGAGTLTMSQGTQIRPYSNITAGWAFAGSATGTITHLAGLRVLFPDNSGSAVTVTNNYGLLINDQTANTGTVTYTNRWGIYQEGTSDLNYFAANVLIKSTVNNGNALQITGNGNLTGDLIADAYYLNGMTAGNGALYWTSDRVTLANYNASGTVEIETNAGTRAVTFTAAQVADFASYINVVGNAATNSAIFINNNSGSSGTAQNYIDFKAGSTVITRMLRGNGAAGYESNGLNIDNFAGFQVRTNQLGGSGGNTVFTGGNFGINTTNPLLSCQISALSGSQFALNLNTSDFVNSTTGTRLLFGFGATTGNTYASIAANTTGGLSSGNLVLNDSSGNVLIGTSTDAGQKLQVNGTAAISGDTAIGSTLTQSLTLAATLTSTATTTIWSNFPVNRTIQVAVTIQWTLNGNAQRSYLLLIGAANTGWGIPNSGIAQIQALDWSAGFVGAATFSISGSGSNRSLDISVANANVNNVFVYITYQIM
jgi:hypothetical protein